MTRILLRRTFMVAIGDLNVPEVSGESPELGRPWIGDGRQFRLTADAEARLLPIAASLALARPVAWGEVEGRS